MLAEATGQEVVTPVKSRGFGDGGAGRGSCRQKNNMCLSPETRQHLLSVRTERGQWLKSVEGMG